jgi:hypothetical protein
MTALMIVLGRYESSNARAFVSMQAGATVTVDASNPNTDALLGHLHVGFDHGVPGDLLDDLSTSLPPGFSTPVPSGQYSFWVNQTEPALTFYQFDFLTVAVPEPSTALLGVGAWIVLIRSRAKL